MGVQIFISYRRESGREIARNIYERLSLVGYNTFFDYDSMRNGMFNSQIFTAIDQCSDFIIILTNNSLERCNDKEDWVRLEIEYAIRKSKNIILLTPEDFIGFPHILPESIETIRLINIIFLSSNYYNASIEKLLNALTPVHRSKRKVKRISLAAILLLIISVIYILLSKNQFNVDDKNLIKDCSAQLFLMRYNDLSLIENIKFSNALLEQFHYNDSIDDKSNYIIYPIVYKTDKSDVSVIQLETDSILPIYYHSPILRLKLQSEKNKTLVFNRCYIEIDSCSIDPTNYFRFFLKDNGFIISNESGSAWETCTLNYSFLHKGETFTKYKESKILSYFNNTLTIPILPNEREIMKGEVKFTSNQTIGLEYLPKKNIDLYEITKGVEFFLKELNPSNNIQEITVNFTKNKQELEISDFNKSLVSGEVDDDFYFKIFSPESYVYRIRLRLEAIDGSDNIKYLYSNYVYIHNFKPKHGVRIL